MYSHDIMSKIIKLIRNNVSDDFSTSDFDLFDPSSVRGMAIGGILGSVFGYKLGKNIGYSDALKNSAENQSLSRRLKEVN